MMSYEELVAAVEREAAAITETLGSGPDDAPVPTCPDWDVHALARHVGEFTVFWAHVVSEATGRPKIPYDATPPRDPASLPDWYSPLADDLVAGLAATSADHPAWTWVPSQQRIGFIARRCANELAVHRYDAEAARGRPHPIEPSLAAECVLEIPLLLEGWAQQTDFTHEGSGRSLHLCPTDSANELLLTLAADDLEIDRRHSDEADLTLRGTTSDLALVLFDRPPLGAVERVGDDSVLGAWYREFHFG